MASPSKAFSATTLLLLAVIIMLLLPECHADHPVKKTSSIHHVVRRVGNPVVSLKHKGRPPFKPGPWKQGHATFYEGGSGTFGGACGYEDVVKMGYGLNTAALSAALFNNGQKCGACFEIKCVDSSEWCKPGQPSLIVTATDSCPPNYDLPSDNGGWCNPPRAHFDLAKPAFGQIAEYQGGIVPVQYRRVPCKKQGGIRFTVTGNPYFNLVSVWNVGGAGDVISVHVLKGDNKQTWIPLKRNWGQKWETDAKLVGEDLSFRVRTSDGKTSTSWHVAPKNWQFDQTFLGSKNFRGLP
ncbi:PREDICTED: expansin-A9 [Theobroma cacao]|uniref:Expansin n=2 Tax=Theobroma cacao TaxID=3641 RepID=A0A061ETJ7_THECC|nr:PREDICTED: expansin-A9 [Theobroma cacao]EOY07988.1 Alpha-expansin 3 precursor [Theobroma cacao]